MCEFLQLYFGKEGYVVCCKSCNCYQLNYAGVILTLNKDDLTTLRDVAKQKLVEQYGFLDENVKQIALPTPYTGVSIFLSKQELKQFTSMLDGAGTEMTVRAMLTCLKAHTITRV